MMGFPIGFLSATAVRGDALPVGGFEPAPRAEPVGVGLLPLDFIIVVFGPRWVSTTLRTSNDPDVSIPEFSIAGTAGIADSDAVDVDIDRFKLFVVVLMFSTGYG